MSVWYSSVGEQNKDDSGDVISNVVNIYVDVTTDADGMFTIDLSQYDIDYVIDSSGYVVGQVLDALTDVTALLSVMIVEVTSTVVKGVVVLANNVTAGIGVLVKPVKRAGSGIDAKIKVKAVKN